MTDPDLERMVRDGATRYFAARRDRVAGFCDRHFTVSGSARLHRAALGWDIARAPANLALALPALALKGGAWAAGCLGAPRVGGWLGARQMLLRTDVARAIDRLIRVELLELPVDGSGRDALAEAILAQPEVAARLAPDLAVLAATPEFQREMAAMLETYAGSRGAAAEIATTLLTLGVGGAALSQATPGMISLGPAVAGALAQAQAVASFPLGAAAGGLWYGLFPAAASPLLVVGATGGLAAVGAVATAFAGVIADPVQHALGWHQGRLHRLIDALEARFLGDDAASFTAREPYIARLGDLFDVVSALARAARGN